MGGGDSKRCARHFSQASREWVKEEGIWPVDSRSLILAFLCQSSLSLLYILGPPPPPKLQPSPVAMASALSSSHLQTSEDLRKLRKVIGCQAVGYDDKMWCGIASLTGVRPCEFLYFSAYAFTGLVLPFSSFFFTRLETYDIQLQHLTLHSITLVAVFVHLCEMYVCVRPSMHLLSLFHVLCYSR
jgi:hypothetical protein